MTGLWTSVQRGGAAFTGNVTLRTGKEPDVFACTFQLLPGTLTEQVRHSMKRFMHSYARASGWALRGASFHPGFVSFSISRSKAASRTCKKP